jgi:hypothetical protein
VIMIHPTCPDKTRRGLRLGLAVLLVVNASVSLSRPAAGSPSDAPASVLELQQLVNAVLEGGTHPSIRDDAQTILAIQRVLLETVAPDPEPATAPPSHRVDGTVPQRSTPPLLAVLCLTRSTEGWPTPALSAEGLPRASAQPPPRARCQLRYQFHLLSNAPPKMGWLPCYKAFEHETTMENQP